MRLKYQLGCILTATMICWMPLLNGQISLFDSASKTDGTIKVYEHGAIQRTTELKMNSSLITGQKQLPSELVFNPFPDVAVKLYLDTPTTSSFKGLKVIRLRSDDERFDHLPHYRDGVLIYNPRNGVYVLQLSSGRGAFEMIPTSHTDTYKVSEWRDEALDCQTVDHTHLMNKNTRPISKNSCEEQDMAGVYIADLFIGYSYEAAFQVQDYDAHALSLAEEVNNGLANSLVDNIRLRLVGTAIDENNPGVVTSVLDDVRDWFEEEIALTAADYIAAIQVPTGANTEAGGWAGVGGNTSVNSIHNAAAVLRHELGHNIGSGHCDPGILPYAAGYDTGNVRTHMCGNSVNFFSTPLVDDAFGMPMGDAATADNARVWKERAHVVAATRIHTIAYDDEDLGCISSLENGQYHIQHIGSDLYISTVNEGTNGGTRLASDDVSNEFNLWDLTHIGNSQYTIQLANTNRRIDVPGGNTAAGTDLIIWPANGTNNQVFLITEVANNEFLIRSPSGQCLQLENQVNNVGSPIEQNDCDDSANTKWRFVASGGGSDFSVEVNTTNVSCFGQDDGSASVLASGGSANYTYAWSNGGDSASQENLKAGGYTVTVSDGNEQIPYSFVILQTAPFATSIAVANSNGADGAITLTTSGGADPYSYDWSSGHNGSTLMDLGVGLYTVTITDNSGCAQIKEIYVPCAVERAICDDTSASTVGDVYQANCTCSGVEVTCASAASDLVNISRSRPASQSSTRYNGDASRAVDGNTDGHYHDASSTTHTDEDLDNPWWQVDLESIQHVSAMAIWNRTDGFSGRLKNYKVFISETPFLSDDPMITEDQDGVTTFEMEVVPRPVSVLQIDASGRYVRIQIPGESQALSLAEVEVYSCINQTTSVSSESEVLFTEIQPNPFQESTKVVFEIEEVSSVDIQLLSVDGAIAETVYLSKRVYPGRHEITLLNNEYPAGIYFLSINTDYAQRTVKVIIVE